MALAKGTRARQATMSLADPYQTERTRRHRLAPSARSPVLRHPPALRLVGKRAAGGGEGVGHVAWIAGGRDDGGDGGMGEDPLQEELGPARCTNRAYTCGSIVSAQVDRRSLERWLAANGFVLEPGKKTGHKHYSRQGIKIAIPGHGPQDPGSGSMRRRFGGTWAREPDESMSLGGRARRNSCA